MILTLTAAITLLLAGITDNREATKDQRACSLQNKSGIELVKCMDKEKTARDLRIIKKQKES